jgi:hypothetical protein
MAALALGDRGSCRSLGVDPAEQARPMGDVRPIAAGRGGAGPDAGARYRPRVSLAEPRLGLQGRRPVRPPLAPARVPPIGRHGGAEGNRQHQGGAGRQPRQHQHDPALRASGGRHPGGARRWKTRPLGRAWEMIGQPTVSRALLTSCPAAPASPLLAGRASSRRQATRAAWDGTRSLPTERSKKSRTLPKVVGKTAGKCARCVLAQKSISFCASACQSDGTPGW